MSKKEINKYLIPIELIQYQPAKLLGVKVYEYKLYSDISEQKFSHIRFIDFNGLMIGEHIPTKLHTVYDKAALQVKTTTVKAVSEIKHVVGEVTDIAVAAASEMKEDISNTAKQTTGIAVSLFGKVKKFIKNKKTE